jgi:hypothetical protein
MYRELLIVGATTLLMGTSEPAWSNEGHTLPPSLDVSAARGLPTTMSVPQVAFWVLARPERSPNYPLDCPRLTIEGARLRAFVQDAAARSPHLRQQLARLTADPRLTVRLTLARPSSVQPGLSRTRARAATRITSTPDGVDVDVALTVEPGTVELLGHELEHILEHLDGVRVTDRFAARDEAVWRGRHTYETRRAVVVGRIVAAEFAGRTFRSAR